MKAINMLEAKSHLSRLVEAVASGAQEEVLIARNGKPVARLVGLPARPRIRLGLAKGRYKIPDDFDRDNATIATMFGVES